MFDKAKKLRSFWFGHNEIAEILGFELEDLLVLLEKTIFFQEIRSELFPHDLHPLLGILKLIGRSGISKCAKNRTDNHDWSYALEMRKLGAHQCIVSRSVKVDPDIGMLLEILLYFCGSNDKRLVKFEGRRNNNRLLEANAFKSQVGIKGPSELYVMVLPNISLNHGDLLFDVKGNSFKVISFIEIEGKHEIYSVANNDAKKTVFTMSIAKIVSDFKFKLSSLL